MLLVRIAPVLDGVDDHVPVGLLDVELLQEPVQTVPAEPVEVDPRGLVGDPVRQAPRTDRHVEALRRGRGADARSPEHEHALEIELMVQGLGQDLGEGALVRGLGEPGLRDAGAEVGGRHRLQSHRLGELGDDREQEAEEEQDHDERDAPLAPEGARARVLPH